MAITLCELAVLSLGSFALLPRFFRDPYRVIRVPEVMAAIPLATFDHGGLV